LIIMNKTTENLWEALRNYVPPVTPPVIFRLFYNIETGKPLDLTTEDREFDSTTVNWIEISRSEADTYPHQDPSVSVINGKLIRKITAVHTEEQPNRLTVTLDCNGDVATDDYSMLIINSTGKKRWKYE
jgi:hypothetical protein